MNSDNWTKLYIYINMYTIMQLQFDTSDSTPTLESETSYSKDKVIIYPK